MSGLHHNRDYVAAVDAERRSAASARRRAGSVELEALVRAAARGEEAAWSSLVGRFTRRLTRLVQSYRVPAQDAEDVVQTTFVRLYDHIDSLRDPKALPGWLDTTARREALKCIRAARRECPLDGGVLENLPAPHELDERPSEALDAELDQAIERLPERQRALLRLLDSNEALSYEEISSRLEMPIGSIGPTRGRALTRLRADGRLVAVAAAAAAARRDGDEGPASRAPWGA